MNLRNSRFILYCPLLSLCSTVMLLVSTARARFPFLELGNEIYHSVTRILLFFLFLFCFK